MRKLKVSSFVSLDGVTENPQAISEGYFDDEARKFAFELLGGVEYFLAGRVSYEIFRAMWEKMAGNPYVDKLLAMKKIVASRREPDVVTAIKEIKAQAGGDIMKYGVTSLDRTLLEHGLVDEYNLWIFPKIVGKGKRAFEDVNPGLVNLSLTSSRRFSNGVMVLSYACATR